MKSNLRVLIAGLALIVVTNAIALVGVAYNRSGEPDAILELTERELPRPYEYGFEEENSGVALNLNWRVGQATDSAAGYYEHWAKVSWIDKEKLLELGFDVDRPLTSESVRRSYAKSLPRPVYLVLEYDGKAYQDALAASRADLVEAEALLLNNPGKAEFEKRLESARQRLLAEERFNSRLFVIDAGLEPEALRSRYDERAKYLILRGQVDMRVIEVNGVHSLEGYIRGLDIESVNVPVKYHAILAPFKALDRHNEEYDGPRYGVRLAFGKRLEPWILDLYGLK